MRIIDRYIFREILSHALLGLGVFTFVIFVPQLVQIMNVVARGSGDSRQVALLFFSAFPRVLTFSVPIGVLVGVLIGLGRMSADSELIAMNAAGIGLKRLLVPVGPAGAIGHWAHAMHDGLARADLHPYHAFPGRSFAEHAGFL